MYDEDYSVNVEIVDVVNSEDKYKLLDTLYNRTDWPQGVLESQLRRLGYKDMYKIWSRERKEFQFVSANQANVQVVYRECV